MKKLTVFFVLLCLLSFGAQAQDDETHPLIQLMSGVPVEQAVNPMALISYVDFHGIDRARTGVPNIDDAADFATLSADDTNLWIANRSRVVTGIDMSRGFIDPESTRELLGFTITDITQLLTFDQPPQFATLALVDKPFGVIRSAFLARDYQRLDDNGVETLCYEGDCTSGQKTNIQDVNPANFFGGHLGRNEVFALFEDDQLVVNSPEDSQVQAVGRAYTDQALSILSLPQYAIVTDALINHEGDLLQTMFISPAMMDYADMVVYEESLVIPEDVAELPLYFISNINDYQIGDEQVASLSMLVDSEENAQIAIDEMQKRMAVHPLFVARSEDMDIRIETSTYVDPDGNGVVAFVDYYYAMPTEMEGVIGAGNASGVLINNFVMALYRNELTPLMIGLAPESE